MISKRVRKTAYTDSHLVVDAVWPTKLRRPLLATPEIKASVETRLRAVARANDSIITHLEVAADNVRLRLTVPPDVALLSLITKLKADSARHLRVTFPELNTKVSGIWSWHSYLRSIGNPANGAADAYLLRTKGLSSPNAQK